MSKEPPQQRDVFCPFVLSGYSRCVLPCAYPFFDFGELCRHAFWRRSVVFSVIVLSSSFLSSKHSVHVLAMLL